MTTTPGFSRRQVLSLTAAVMGTSAWPYHAQANTKIVFEFSVVNDFASVFVAKEEGYFSKRGLDVEPKFIPLNPSIPAAIQSDSLQMGGPTPSVYLQAVDGGLDHVVVGGGGMTSKSITGVGFVARAGSGIRTTQDCVGRKIGVPGLGAYLHVTFRAWLKLNGVDPTKVNFIEASFPQHSDLLRSGSLDGVVTDDPFMARILASGTGYVASCYTTFRPMACPALSTPLGATGWPKTRPPSKHSRTPSSRRPTSSRNPPTMPPCVDTSANTSSCRLKCWPACN